MLAGVEPTPAIAYLTTRPEGRRRRGHLGLAQPARRQRHQVLRAFGYKLPDELEDEIEAGSRPTVPPQRRTGRPLAADARR